MHEFWMRIIIVINC